MPAFGHSARHALGTSMAWSRSLAPLVRRLLGTSVSLSSPSSPRLALGPPKKCRNFTSVRSTSHLNLNLSPPRLWLPATCPTSPFSSFFRVWTLCCTPDRTCWPSNPLLLSFTRIPRIPCSLLPQLPPAFIGVSGVSRIALVQRAHSAPQLSSQPFRGRRSYSTSREISRLVIQYYLGTYLVCLRVKRKRVDIFHASKY